MDLNHTKKVTHQVRMQGITICIPQNLIYKYVETHISIISLLLKILIHHINKNKAHLTDKLMNKIRNFQNYPSTRLKILRISLNSKIFLSQNQRQTSKQKQVHQQKATSAIVLNMKPNWKPSLRLFLALIGWTLAPWILK